MSRKIVSILALLCLLAASNSALAYNWAPNTTWHGGQGNNDWFSAANWWVSDTDPNAVPNINTQALIEAKGPEPQINGDATCGYLAIMPWSWPGAGNFNVDMNSGTFDCNYGISIGAQGGLYDSATSGIPGFIVHGGTVTQSASPGDGITVGGGGDGFGPIQGRLIMYGGSVTTRRLALRYGQINLYGGTLECNGDSNFVFSQVRSQNRIDISGGTLRVAGNYTIIAPTFATLIANGSIVSTRGNIGVAVYDSGTNYTTLVASDVNMTRPWGPSPDNNATEVHYRAADVNVGVALTWNDGDINVLNHQVYFGPNSVAVAAATKASAEFVGEVNEVNAEPNSFVIGDINHPYALRINTTYYWRVDANVAVSNIYDEFGNVIGYNTAIDKGLVWNFKTHNGKAYNPKPRNTQVGLNEPMALTWTAGDFAASTSGHFVYVGTDASSVTNATSTTAIVFRGRQTGTSYSLANLATGWYSTALNPGTTYYWKVTEINNTTQWGNGLSNSVVWSFTPAPYITIDDFEDYNSTADLAANWGMNYAIPSCNLDGYGYVSVTATSGNLSFAMDSVGKHGSYYYNAVPFSEVRRNYPGGTIFTNSSVLSVQPAALRVDYLGAALNGVDEIYNRMYVAIEDTAGNVGILENPDGNAAQVTSWTQWYSSLKDINAAGYPNVVQLKAVSNFYLGFGLRCLPSNDQGLGGDGNVMFDNIRLYAQTCNPSITLSADMDGDCDADINDLLVFSTFWLAQAQTISYPGATAPINAPVLWYKFNDSGNTTDVVDYGTGDTNSYTGTVNRWSGLNWNATGGRNGGPCLYIPSVPTTGGGASNSQSYVSAPPAAVGFMGNDAHALDNGGGVTVSVWMNASMIGDFLVQYPGIWGIWNAANSAETVEVPTPSHLTVGATTAQAGFFEHTPGTGTTNTYRPLLDFGGRWNHWAWVKTAHNGNVNNPDLGSLRIYCNGALVASQDANGEAGDPNVGATGPLFPVPAGAVRIGTRGDNWAMWSGKLADFQIYDYALSDQEIEYLATDGTGNRVLPLVTRSNLKSSGNPATEIVDFQDLSVMGDQWHQIQLWP